MKKSKLFLFLFVFVFSAGATLAQNEKGGSGEVKEGATRGNELNIKVSKEDRENGNTETKTIIGPEDGGEARGGWCEAAIKNYTNAYLLVYVDEYYEGVIGPGAYGSMYVEPGVTSVAAVTELNDGTLRWWGPIERQCNYETLRLNVYATSWNWSLR